MIKPEAQAVAADSLDEVQGGRVIYVLIMTVLTQFTYPITESGSFLSNTIWQVLVLGLMIANIRLTPPRSRIRRLVMGATIIWAIVTVNYTFNQTAVWALFVGYFAYGTIYFLVIKTLVHFIFEAEIVDREVLYAASAAFLLIGGAFVAIYGVIEMTTYVQTGGGHAFTGVGIEHGTLLPWQDLIYFSYVALTTLGFGDMSPVTMWARSVAISEGIIGVLYVTIIMARLVGLYVTREQSDAT